MSKQKATCRMYVDVEYDPDVTDAESLSDAMDVLMDTAKSTPNILDEYGDPWIGGFFVLKEAKSQLPAAGLGPYDIYEPGDGLGLK